MILKLSAIACVTFKLSFILLTIKLKYHFNMEASYIKYIDCISSICLLGFFIQYSQLNSDTQKPYLHYLKDHM